MRPPLGSTERAGTVRFQVFNALVLSLVAKLGVSLATDPHILVIHPSSGGVFNRLSHVTGPGVVRAELLA